MNTNLNNTTSYVNTAEFFEELNSILTKSTESDRLKFKDKIKKTLSKEMATAKTIHDIVFVMLVIRCFEQ
jgi:hypothetical protein